MGIFDKIKKPENNEYDNGYDDDYYNEFDGYDNGDDSDIYGGGNQNANTQQNINMGAQNAGMGGGMYQNPNMGSNGGISLSGSAIELKVVKPERFESASQIANHLLNKRTVVLNLENTNKETARRLIDFLCGVAYSIDGQLKKVATNAYVITPNNVDVSGEALKERKNKEDDNAESDDESYNDF